MQNLDLTKVKTQDMVVCPLCLHNKKIKRKKETWSFTLWNPDESPFIIVQACPGGKVAGTGKGYRGSATTVGFPKVAEYKIDDIVEIEEYNWLLIELKEQILKILKKLLQLGIVRRDELEILL